MNRLTRWKTSLALISVLTLTACVLANRIYEMVALGNGHDVAFTLPALDTADKDTRFMLNGIGVSTNDACTEDCVFWQMGRPLDSNVDLMEENFVKFPIKYGVTLPNMQTRIYKPLRKGRYVATAWVAMIKNGKIIDSKRVGAVFMIE
jgi:hypothetical protein